MAASAGAWYRVGTVNVVGGSQSVVGVDTNWQNDVTAIAIGDIFTLDAKVWYEVTAVNSDTSITIDRGFEGSTGSNQNYAILRNTSGTILTRIAGQVSVQFNQKQLFLDELRTWLNSDNASEELTDSHGLTQSLKTPSQMVRDHDEKLAQLDAIHPNPWAMRKVDFEANRAANNEKFAASGFVHFGKHRNDSSLYEEVNQGLYTHQGIGNTLQVGTSNNKEGLSETDFPNVLIAGTITSITSLGDANYSRIRFPPAEDGTRTYDSATGTSTTHSTPQVAFASETSTNKVVTDRVDIWGFEAFFKEIHSADPFVYKYGLIQSLASDISGVPTVSDSVRPDSFFSWYEGDTTSRGKGVDWYSASEAQRSAIASDPANNIYFDDETGKFYQWCLRGRSFAGIGNGDWDTIDANKSASLTLRQQSVGTAQRTSPQGILNQALENGEGSNYYSNTASTYNDDPRVGLFTSRRNDVSSLGYAYFLVCGTVNRLNRGAYHPSFNPAGTSGFGTEDNPTWAVKWHSTSGIRAATSTADCFVTYNNGGSRSENAVSGSISQGVGEATHPSDRFYDVIYASGQGGVCRDMRFSSKPVGILDAENKDIQIKQGDARGFEIVPFTYLAYHTYSAGNKSYVNRNYNDKSLNVGDAIIVKDQPTGKWVRRTISSVDGNQAKFADQQTINLLSDSLIIWEMRYKKAPIAGSYTHTDVICDPENLVNVPQLSEGWWGTWIPVSPEGSSQDYPLSKIITGDSLIRTYSDNNGSNWIRDGVTVDAVLNSRSENWQSSRVALYQYEARASLTAPSAIYEVYSGLRGVGAFYASSRGNTNSSGRELGHSLAGVACNSSSGVREQSSPLLSHGLRSDLKQLSSDGLVLTASHAPIELTALAGQVAYKCLYYVFEKDSMLYLNYIYKELYYTDLQNGWGDDQKFDVYPYQRLNVDDNGYPIIVGTSQYLEPLGWVKNDK